MRYQTLGKVTLNHKQYDFNSRLFRLAFIDLPGAKENKLPPNTNTHVALVLSAFGAIWLTLTPFVKGSRKQRVFATCLLCGKMVPAGRLAQHINTNTCK